MTATELGLAAQKVRAQQAREAVRMEAWLGKRPPVAGRGETETRLHTHDAGPRSLKHDKDFHSFVVIPPEFLQGQGPALAIFQVDGNQVGTLSLLCSAEGGWEECPVGATAIVRTHMRSVRFPVPPTGLQLLQWAATNGVEVTRLHVLTQAQLAKRLDEEIGSEDVVLADLGRCPVCKKDGRMKTEETRVRMPRSLGLTVERWGVEAAIEFEGSERKAPETRWAGHELRKCPLSGRLQWGDMDDDTCLGSRGGGARGEGASTRAGGTCAVNSTVMLPA